MVQVGSTNEHGQVSRELLDCEGIWALSDEVMAGTLTRQKYSVIAKGSAPLISQQLQGTLPLNNEST